MEQQVINFINDTDWYVWSSIALAIVIPYVMLFRLSTKYRKLTEELEDARAAILLSRRERRHIKKNVRKKFEK